MIFDAHYHNPKLAKLFDFSNGWSADRDFYLALAKPEPQKILDLGCGTGLLCDAYAGLGHDVTGVEPSDTMLDIARTKPNASKIEWVLSTAQNYKTQKKFDLVVMTGHAFQVLFEAADVRATLAVVKKCLKPHGAFVFETRNPEINWSRKWNYHIELDLPEGPVAERRRFLRMKNNRMTSEFQFQFSDEKLVTANSLRFWSQREIEHYLTEAGFNIEHLYGDWEKNEIQPTKSKEMIFITKPRT